MKYFFSALLLLITISATAQTTEPETPENPLQPFEFLIGGGWYGSASYQTFEWGVGQKLVKSKLYFVRNDTLRHVGEMMWFWHPGEEVIRGYGISINMANDFFEYTTSFDGPRRMVNDYSSYGGPTDYPNQHVTLDFIDENVYKWTYYEMRSGEWVALYSIDYERRERIRGVN